MARIQAVWQTRFLQNEVELPLLPPKINSATASSVKEECQSTQSHERVGKCVDSGNAAESSATLRAMILNLG